MSGPEPEIEANEANAEETARLQSEFDELTPSEPVEPSEPDEPEEEPDSSPVEPTAGVSEANSDLASAASNPWGIASRVVTLSALLAIAGVMWFEVAFKSPWVVDFLLANATPPGLRSTLLAAFALALVAGAAGGAGLLVWMRKHEHPWSLAERWLWFLSPLLLLPIVPLLFRYKPWQGKHQALLIVVIVASLVLEVLVRRSLESVPEEVLEWWESTRDELPLILRRQGPLIVVLASTFTYVVFMSFYLVRWHYKLRTHNFDLSINNNLIFGGLHGKFLESPVVFPSDPKKYLANHAKFGTYLFLPIYGLWPKPQTLLVLQSVLLGMSALPLYGFARRHVSDWVAVAVTLAYLAYYPMHGANFSEFQNVPVAAFFVLATIWGLETRRYVLCGLAAAVAMLLREDVPVGLVIVGGFALLSGYRPLPGLVLAAVSMTYFVYLRFHLMDEAGEWWYPNMYKDLWADGKKGYASVIKTLITNPLFVLSKIAVEKKFLYLMHLLVPIVFLPARRWYLWAAFIPGILLTLLVTNYDPPILFSFHYVMHWAPYLFVATPLALAAIERSRDQGVSRMRAAVIAMLGASLVLSYNYGAFSRRPASFKGGYASIDFSWSDGEAFRYEQLMSLARLIPDDASVAATETVGPHVSSRDLMYTLRTGPHGAEYMLASSRELKLSRTKPQLKAALDSGKYGVVKRVGEFALFKRGFDTSQNQKLSEDWHL